MKSAIFQERQPLLTRATLKSTIKRRPQTQSPQISPSNGPSFSSWSLDDLIANYTISGVLPVPLSPTLPPRFQGKKFEPEDNEHEEDDDSNESEVDHIPVSLLSPAPVNGPKIIQPTAKSLVKDSYVPAQSIGSATPMKTGSVRVVNRLSDQERPRLLVRINYKAMAFKSKQKTTSKVHEETQTLKKALETQILEENVKTSKKLSDFKPRPSWAGIIKDLHTQCGKMSRTDFFFSVVLEFDAIICSILACDPEERPKLYNKTGTTERNWMYVLASIPQFVSRIEKHLKSNTVSDRKKSMLSFLVAILAIIRALLLKRVNAHTELQIDHFSAKQQTLEALHKISDLRKQVIDNYHKMEDNFAQSQSFFTLSPAPVTVYPHSWHNRAFSIPRPSSAFLSPSLDKYFLPLGPYSDLREAVAYLYNCVKEFSEIFESEINGGVRYTLQSGQKKNR